MNPQFDSFSAARTRHFDGTFRDGCSSSRMTQLIRFMLFNLMAGFLIGLVVGFAFMLARDLTHLPAQEPLAAIMLLWGFGASFGMGVLGTGLGLLPPE